MLCLLFFFSSRRRHTRYWRDWSSDVCSSDLRKRHGASAVGRVDRGRFLGREEIAEDGHALLRKDHDDVAVRAAGPEIIQVRSEERRVGKEWRCRWARKQWTNNIQKRRSERAK